MSLNKNIFDRTISSLRLQYWLSIAVLASYFLLLIFDLLHNPFKGVEVGVTLERYAIVITIIAIPAAFKLFAEMLKKVSPASDIKTVVKSYKKASNIRLLIINIVTFMNISLYAISGNMNFFWFTIVLFIIYIFCKPSYSELAGLADKDKLNEQADSDNEKNS
ncbi:MAG: hypothetical protein PHV53_02255 [Fermentimonas sp.]|jgi:hypothetical protein|nr:hypothetical protein [Fermentimonas sp.]